ncbi:CotH kinase family protein [bacterium]|nr:CotH kinase family protein [bacterium]
MDRGFYRQPIVVAITTETPGATIRYSLDGSAPSLTHGQDYVAPLLIERTTVLRAAAFKEGHTPSNVDTQTYLFIGDVIHQCASGEPPGPGWPAAPVNNQVFDYGMDPDVVNDPRYAELMDDALLAIPSLSIVTDLANLVDPATGIYVNAYNDEREWERPISLELLRPDGGAGFQIDAGLRIRGGGSRTPTNPKHSFRLFFRSEYGQGKLRYPMFGAEGVAEFDKLDLRTAQNFSWHSTPDEAYATWLYDVFCRDCQRDMGRPYTRSRYYHLYINGHYWGLYQSEERLEARYAESYLGGDKDDYDTVKVGDFKVMEAADGTLDAYQALWTAVNAGVGDVTAYFRVQGKNADGSSNPAYPRLLDVDNLIDYMLVVFYTGSRDTPIGPPGRDTEPRNIYALYNRAAPDGFKFVGHDFEHTLGVHLDEVEGKGVEFNRVNVALRAALQMKDTCNPWFLHLKCAQGSAEYRMRFADRARRHFGRGGALSAEASAARFLARQGEIELAIIAESARWGDYLSPERPRTRDDDWLPAVRNILNQYLLATPRARPAVVLDQLRARGWYPAVEAPELVPPGGRVPSGLPLSASAVAEEIYYRLDGGDPRAVGGGVDPQALRAAAGSPPVLRRSTLVAARARSGGEWSALSEATFTVVPTWRELFGLGLAWHDAEPPAGPDYFPDGLIDEKDLLILKDLWRP